MNAQADLLKSRIEDAARDRHHVRVVVNVDGLSDRLNGLRDEAEKTLKTIEEEERNRNVAKLQKEVLALQSAAIPNEEEIVKLESVLQKLPSDDSNVKVLADELQLIRLKKKEQEAVEKELAERVSGIATEVDDVEKALVDVLNVEEDKQKKFEADDLERLKKLDEKVDGVLRKELNDILNKAADGNIAVDGLKPEAERIERLTDKLKVSIVMMFVGAVIVV